MNNKKNIKYGFTSKEPIGYINKYRGYNKPNFIYCYIPVYDGINEENKFRYFLETNYSNIIKFNGKKDEFFDIEITTEDFNKLIKEYFIFSENYDNNYI